MSARSWENARKIQAGSRKKTPRAALLRPEIFQRAPESGGSRNERGRKRRGGVGDLGDRSAGQMPAGMHPIVQVIPKKQHDFHADHSKERLLRLMCWRS